MASVYFGELRDGDCGLASVVTLREMAMSAWIQMISDDDASQDVRAAFDEARSPAGQLENVMRIHSLRPNTMRGHVRLYRAVLHDEANTVSPAFQETIAAYVSLLNDCAYSFTNHWANAKHLIDDDARAAAISAALEKRRPGDAFDGKELAALQYTEVLTLTPGDVTQAAVESMREAGFDDGEILEINQICSLFAYANRMLNGLGVSLADQQVGYYVEPEAED
jgi:uncharacterized peroxidase-related enzyme